MIIMSSNTPNGFTVDRFANSNIVGVGLGFGSPRVERVLVVITLISTPRSTKVFGRLV